MVRLTVSGEFKTQTLFGFELDILEFGAAAATLHNALDLAEAAGSLEGVDALLAHSRPINGYILVEFQGCPLPMLARLIEILQCWERYVLNA